MAQSKLQVPFDEPFNWRLLLQLAVDVSQSPRYKAWCNPGWWKKGSTQNRRCYPQILIIQLQPKWKAKHLSAHFMETQIHLEVESSIRYYCETQPPASIGWVALSSVVCSSFVVPHCNNSSYFHYMMFQTIQTIYFLWGYDPGNVNISSVFIAE